MSYPTAVDIANDVATVTYWIERRLAALASEEAVLRAQLASANIADGNLDEDFPIGDSTYLQIFGPAVENQNGDWDGPHYAAPMPFFVAAEPVNTDPAALMLQAVNPTFRGRGRPVGQ